MIVKDKGYNDFKKRLVKLGKITIAIGATGQDEDISNHDKFVDAEFGDPTRNLEARAPIRKTIRDNNNLEYYKMMIEQVAKSTMVDVKKVSMALAESVRASIVETFMNRLDPALKPDYAKRKLKEGWTDLPYIKTKTLVNHIVAEPRQK